jgi:glucokinase
MILAGDVGGTKTILAAFQPGGREPAFEATYPSREHGSLHDILDTFVARYRPRLEGACLGIAGPVKDGRTRATNLPWLVDAAAVAHQLGIREAYLINDLEANAWGIPALRPEDFATLNVGAPGASGNAAIIAAGTGLGEAGLYWDGQRHHPFATEGGHTDFAPRDELESDLLRYLLARHEHVSVERLVSGPGLANVYAFLRDTGRGEEPDWLAEAMARDDVGQVISSAAREGRSPLCVQALDVFMSLYGAEAGNLALKTMSTGGMYLGGGIAPKNLWKIQDGSFMKAFAAKGRMRPILEAMPVRVILNQRTALLGAALCASLGAGTAAP